MIVLFSVGFFQSREKFNYQKVDGKQEANN